MTVALFAAERVAGKIVVDAFCGVGGSAVHFAGKCAHVIGIDTCRPRLELAAHNAAVYGVGGRLDLLCTDFFIVPSVLKVPRHWLARYVPS
jgi:trimethylguanosine synthase